jgi:hypothetical protein
VPVSDEETPPVLEGFGVGGKGVAVNAKPDPGFAVGFGVASSSPPPLHPTIAKANSPSIIRINNRLFNITWFSIQSLMPCGESNYRQFAEDASRS